VLSKLSPIDHFGFTLVELMVTIAIAAVLVGVVIPGFFNLIANNRLTVATNELVTCMHFARSEAVRSEVPVSICASTDGQSCSGDLDWGRGWIIFSDKNGTNGMMDGDDELLYSTTIEGDGIRIASENSYVRFSPRGRSIR
jgi:type IV fimbrial biogenesis protein FimT